MMPGMALNWLGREDSNLRMTGSKPVALATWRRPNKNWFTENLGVCHKVRSAYSVKLVLVLLY